jgi:hypothetical protein
VQPMTLRPQAHSFTMLVAAVVIAMAAAPLRAGVVVAAQASINCLVALLRQPLPLQGPPTQDQEGEVALVDHQVQVAQGLSSSVIELLLIASQQWVTSKSCK